jgi:hypothetical protein
VDPRAGLDDLGKRSFLTPPGLELRTLSHPARSLTAIPTTLPRLILIFMYLFVNTDARMRTGLISDSCIVAVLLV